MTIALSLKTIAVLAMVAASTTAIVQLEPAAGRGLAHDLRSAGMTVPALPN